MAWFGLIVSSIMDDTFAELRMEVEVKRVETLKKRVVNEDAVKSKSCILLARMVLVCMVEELKVEKNPLLATIVDPRTEDVKPPLTRMELADIVENSRINVLMQSAVHVSSNDVVRKLLAINDSV